MLPVVHGRLKRIKILLSFIVEYVTDLKHKANCDINAHEIEHC